MDFPTDFVDASVPLVVKDGSQLTAGAVEHLTEQGYSVQLGLTRAWAEQIIAMTRESAILEYCPRDAGERFTDMDATQHWLSKQRAVFLLAIPNETGVLELAGYGWVGHGTSSHVPGGEITFAVRIGESHQGRGLARPFSALMLTGSAQLYGAKNIWLETWASNGGAVHVYHKLGFIDVGQQSDERPTTAGGTVADTRFYMSLPNELLPQRGV